MRNIFDVSILLLLVINCDSLKLNYDHCSINSECKSGKCALMGTDFGNGEPKSIVNVFACVPSDLKTLNQDCMTNSECISGLCVNAMSSSKCVATNYNLNGASCGCNSECYSNFCLNSICSGIPKFNYYLCKNNSECASRVCTLMYTDNGDGRSNTRTNYFTCVPKELLKLGDTCNNNNQCVSRLCVGTINKTKCTESNYMFNGEKCINNTDCFSKQCVKGVCSGLKLNFDTCKYDAECLSGECGYMGKDYGNGLPESIVKRFSCVPNGKVNVGKPCTRNSQCASNLCVRIGKKQKCGASNYRFNYESCKENKDCLSHQCIKEAGKKCCKGIFV